MAHKGTDRIGFHKTVVRTQTHFCADQFPFVPSNILILLLEFWKGVLSIGITSILRFPLMLSHVCVFQNESKNILQHPHVNSQRV